jgi:molecular chaperone HscB
LGPPPQGPFTPDLTKLRKEFLQLQARAHPDRHPEDRKAHAQALSSRINEAYKTLTSPLLRAQYLLSLRGDDSPNDEAAQLGDAQGDQELLMEVLDLRERIEELETEGEVQEMRVENDEKIQGTVEELERAFAEDDLARAKREAVRLRYWVNVGDVLREWEKGKPVVLEHKD